MTIDMIVSYVMGPRRGTQEASFVPADWQVRVFDPSGLIDRPSDNISMQTILLYGYMDRHSCYIPFSSQA